MEPEKVAALIKRPGITVLSESGKPLKVVGEVTPSSSVSALLTPDEAAALEEYRAQRAKDPKAQAASTFDIVVDKDTDAREAVEHAKAEGGTPMGGSASAPLENREILRGEPPPQATSGVVETKQELVPPTGKKR
jgi:hypothetical protein